MIIDTAQHGQYKSVYPGVHAVYDSLFTDAPPLLFTINVEWLNTNRKTTFPENLVYMEFQQIMSVTRPLRDIWLSITYTLTCSIHVHMHAVICNCKL